MKILIALSTCLLLACSKHDSDSGSHCWSCDYSNNAGSNHLDTCTADGSEPKFHDLQGNLLNVDCKRK